MGWMHFEMSSAICYNLDQSKILLSGKGLKIQILWQWIQVISSVCFDNVQNYIYKQTREAVMYII